jgi:hypothetical protein
MSEQRERYRAVASDKQGVAGRIPGHVTHRLGKLAYLTFEIAKRAIRGHRNRLGAKEGRGPVTPYRCRYCSAWHLGHRLK